MLQKCVKLDKLVDAVGSSDLIIHADAVKYKGLTLSSVTTKANTVLLIAQSKDLPSKIVCKVNPNMRSIAFTKLSPDLTKVACFSTQSTISIISTQNFLNFVSPCSIDGLLKTPMFPQELLGFSMQEKKENQNHICSSSNLKLSFIDAFWWTVGEKKFIVVISHTGVDVISTHSFTILKNIPVQDICAAAFSSRSESGKATVALFAKTNTFILTLNLNNGDISHSMTLEGKIFNTQIPILSQFSLVDESHWFLSVLNEKLVFFDGQMMNIPITSFESSSSKTKSYAVTKNFIFHCTNGECSVQFIKSIDVSKHVLMNDALSISVVDAENDSVIISSASKVVMFSLSNDPVSLFSMFLGNHHYREAFALCDGFSLDRKTLCEQAATKCIKNHDYDSALEVLHEGGSEIRPSLQRLISEGTDRHALHLLLRSGLQIAPAKVGKIYDLLLKKIILKHNIFPTLSLAFKKFVKDTDVFLLTFEHAYKTNLLDKLKRGEDVPLPPALAFMMQVKAKIESTKYIKYASSIDINSRLPITFSPQFVALLHAVDRDEKCEELPLPVCSKLRFTKEGKPIYISRNQLSLKEAEDVINNPIISFEIFRSHIYVIDSNFKLFESDTKRICFTESDLPNAVMIETDNATKAVLVTVSGGLAIINTHYLIEYVEGHFVDVALFNGNIYALADDGVVYLINERTKNVIFDDHFVTAICSSFDNGVVYVCDDVIYYNFNGEMASYDLHFHVEFAKSSQSNAILVGEGKIAVVGKEGVNVIDFSQRTGNVLDVVCDDNESVIIVGSSTPPMRVYFAQSNSNNDNDETKVPLYEEAQLIARNYPHDLVIPLTSGVIRTLLLILYGFAEEIRKEKESDILSIIPFFSKMSELHALDSIHVIVSSGFQLSDELLKNKLIHNAFLKYPDDMKMLSKTQLMQFYSSIVNDDDDQTKAKHVTNHKELVYKIFTNEARSVLIQPMHFSDNPLFAFSCSHVMNSTQLAASISSLKNYCEKAKLTETCKLIEENYQQQHISCPCPKCLLRQLSMKY